MVTVWTVCVCVFRALDVNFLVGILTLDPFGRYVIVFYFCFDIGYPEISPAKWAG